MVELVAVVIIIGIFAALALPQISLQLQHRRTRETAERIVLIYQQARFRALGQGTAVLVRFTAGSGTGQGSFETREAMRGDADAKGSGCTLAPTGSCRGDWNDPSHGQFRIIEVFDLNTSYGTAGRIWAELYKSASSTAADTPPMDICFRPSGQALVRFSTTDLFTPLTDVPDFHVYRTISSSGSKDEAGSKAEGLVRHVLVPPIGPARLQL